MKTCLFSLFFFSVLLVQGQNCDQRVAECMNRKDWFGLNREYAACKDSLSPYIKAMAKALTDYYFNRLDSAENSIGSLLNNFPDELADENKLSMIYLLSDCFHRQGKNEEAAGLISEICNQLKSAQTDESILEPFEYINSQYRELAQTGEINRLDRPDKDITIPLSIDTLSNKNKTLMLYLDGTLNGKSGRFLFDTGAGVNAVTPQIAAEYGMRMLEATTIATGIKTGSGGMAIADSLRIGELLFRNVPFYVLDLSTGNKEADEHLKDLGIIIGIPQIERLKEIQLNLAARQLIVPRQTTPNSLAASNLCFSDGRNLLGEIHISNQRLIMKLDTGTPGTMLYPGYYQRNKEWTQANGKPDTVRYAGFAGIEKDTVYLVSNLSVETGRTKGNLKEATISTSKTILGEEGTDGVAGLNFFMAFPKIILNLKEMFIQPLCEPEN